MPTRAGEHTVFAMAHVKAQTPKVDAEGVASGTTLSWPQQDSTS
jgi:hypothetical protein